VPVVTRGAARVELRLYVSGRSAYTQSVLETVEAVVREYDPAQVHVEVREAQEALDDDRVFFTPMVVVKDRFDPARRTVVVGDLRERESLRGVLSGFDVHPRH